MYCNVLYVCMHAWMEWNGMECNAMWFDVMWCNVMWCNVMQCMYTEFYVCVVIFKRIKRMKQQQPAQFSSCIRSVGLRYIFCSSPPICKWWRRERGEGSDQPATWWHAKGRPGRGVERCAGPTWELQLLQQLWPFPTLPQDDEEIGEPASSLSRQCWQSPWRR